MDPAGAVRPPGDPDLTHRPIDRATHAETISRVVSRLMRLSMLCGYRACLDRVR
jgi:hypothetical protein